MEHIKAIAAYRHEHQCLLNVTAKVQGLLDRWEGSKDSVMLKMRINTFVSSILLHLVMEDGHFYPVVEAQGDPIINDKIRRIRKEARELGILVKSLGDRWQGANLAKDFSRCAEEFSGVVALLWHRVIIEEEIFDLMEKHGQFHAGVKYFNSGVETFVLEEEKHRNQQSGNISPAKSFRAAI
ncbi:MAG: Hemerythrin HHE cation binding domain [Magnetococcales bacterium]|nr:Hemerythrin HHE cation binding domain [Magnetococcales bacterium]HIJ85172.1 hemerythrin domain-containing protein [Magnetococcales bacterium]